MSLLRLGRIIAYSLDTPESRGTFGEMIVDSIFHPAFFGEEEHYIVNNIIIETPDKLTHQIDHVAIYKTGIFCIETKNITGQIKGDRDHYRWRVFNKGMTYEIENPIIQNNGHVKVLSNFLNNLFDIHSIIVFTSCNKPKNVGGEVLNLDELKDYIKDYKATKELTSDEMKAVFAILTDYKEDGVISIDEHIDNLKKYRK